MSDLPLVLSPLCSGPEGTSFEDGVFVAELIFPTDYPLSPPKMKFISEIFHPNGMFQPKVYSVSTQESSSTEYRVVLLFN